MNDINASHTDDLVANGDFNIASRGRMLLMTCFFPSSRIQAQERLCFSVLRRSRKLAAGEQMPGWSLNRPR